MINIHQPWSDPMLTVSGLTKHYRGRTAVQDLTFSVLHGEFFGFLGPNGAGKTTTIRMLTGILHPDQGSYTIGSGGTLKNRIGVMPESHGFYGWMTAEEYMMFFATIYGKKSQDPATLQMVRNLLSRVGLSSRKESRIQTYSRGMKQRLGLARALVNDPQILFLDEPTLGLDPQGQKDIQTLLQELHQQGVTIFLSSHLLHEVERVCTRIGIITGGRLVAVGTIDDIRQQAHMETDYAVEIVGALPVTKQMSFHAHIRHVQVRDGITSFLFQGGLERANVLLTYLREQHISIRIFEPDEEALSQLYFHFTSQ